MTNQTEKQIINIIALDRIGIPAKSLSGKLDRRKEKIAESLSLSKAGYTGERAYARVEFEDRMKARKLTEAVDFFCTEYPKYGQILTQMIEDERSVTETYLYFGLNKGCKLSSEDYLNVMRDLGFTEQSARNLYPELIEASRFISRKRKESERSILIG